VPNIISLGIFVNCPELVRTTQRLKEEAEDTNAIYGGIFRDGSLALQSHSEYCALKSRTGKKTAADFLTLELSWKTAANREPRAMVLMLLQVYAKINVKIDLNIVRWLGS
jgi:hypothetical protein